MTCRLANALLNSALVARGRRRGWRGEVLPSRPLIPTQAQHTLDEVRPRLAGTMFQKDLGTLLDKSERVEVSFLYSASAQGACLLAAACT